MRKILTLRNTFHGTKYLTEKTAEQLGAIEGRMWMGTASGADEALVRKIRKALCGVEGCQCSDFLGVRE